jgi:hypothetical protein
MTKENNLDPVVQAVWPDYDEYWAMSADERHAYALEVLNQDREILGAPPLDHIPTDKELAQAQAQRDKAYQKQYHSWSARWNRLLDRLLGPAY